MNSILLIPDILENILPNLRLSDIKVLIGLCKTLNRDIKCSSVWKHFNYTAVYPILNAIDIKEIFKMWQSLKITRTPFHEKEWLSPEWMNKVNRHYLIYIIHTWTEKFLNGIIFMTCYKIKMI